VGKAKNVPTKARLASELGVSYYTLVTRYWDKPGRPKDNSPGSARYNVQAYRDWIGGFKSAHNFGTGHNGNGAFPTNEREQALIDKKKIEIERERFKLDVERREYLKRTEVNEQISTCNSLIRRELYKAFEYDLPPRVEGLSALEIKKMNRRRLDEILHALPKLFINSDGKV